MKGLGRMNDRYAWTAALVVTAVSAVCAQDIWVGGGRFSRFGARFATASDFDGSFQYCRAFYTSFGRGGWRTDYPGADNNFSVRLAELTRVKVKLDETPAAASCRRPAATTRCCAAVRWSS